MKCSAHPVMKGLAAATLSMIVFFHSPSPGLALTLEEAISASETTLPAYKSAQIKVLSRKALYNASLSPYLPSLDASTAQELHRGRLQDADQSAYNVDLSYTLFDGGRRSANRQIAKLNWDYDREDALRTLHDLQFGVKVAFYTSLAAKEIVESRNIQLQFASKDLEVAQGRHKLGVAKLSDVLQARVRAEQSKYNLGQAEGDLTKAVSELNSLVGRYLDTPYDLQGALASSSAIPDLNRLAAAAMQRPEIKQAEITVGLAQSNKKLRNAAFFPVISGEGSLRMTDYYIVQEGIGFTRANTDKAVGLLATWNLFELGKFYRRQSAQFDIEASRERLNDTIRQFLLDLRKAFENMVTASKNIPVAEEQLKQADHSYSQAFGEYKVGKGDILALLRAEGDLASSREQLTKVRLELHLSRSVVERACGVTTLEGF